MFQDSSSKLRELHSTLPGKAFRHNGRVYEAVSCKTISNMKLSIEVKSLGKNTSTLVLLPSEYQNIKPLKSAKEIAADKLASKVNQYQKDKQEVVKTAENKEISVTSPLDKKSRNYRRWSDEELCIILFSGKKNKELAVMFDSVEQNISAARNNVKKNSEKVETLRQMWVRESEAAVETIAEIKETQSQEAEVAADNDVETTSIKTQIVEDDQEFMQQGLKVRIKKGEDLIVVSVSKENEHLITIEIEK